MVKLLGFFRRDAAAVEDLVFDFRIEERLDHGFDGVFNRKT